MGVLRPGGGNRSVRYLFIDGAYFQRAVSSLSGKLGLEETIPIDFQRLSSDYDRTIYYDSLPAQKKGQDEADYNAESEEKQAFLNNLRKIRNFHVRGGFTRVRPRAETRIEQKGVDTWIAIEALQYAFRNTIDVAEIITGDLDLYPLFEALLQTNTRGVLHYEEGSTSEDLIMAADEARPMTPTSILRWSDGNWERGYKEQQTLGRKKNRF